jgi:hypothetical protein
MLSDYGLLDGRAAHGRSYRADVVSSFVFDTVSGITEFTVE